MKLSARLKKMLADMEARKTALSGQIDAATDAVAVRSLMKDIEAVNANITELRAAITEAEASEAAAEAGAAGNDGGTDGAGAEGDEGGEIEGRGKTPVGGFKPLGTYTMGTARGKKDPEGRDGEPEDKYATLEYRQAFMKFAQKGEINPALFPEQRANEMTTTTDISAVIPTTILNEVIRKIQIYGQVYKRLRKLNIKGGVTVPILSLKPTATWIGESSTSEKKKVQANSNVTFAYYGLECKVSTSLLADTVSLAGFENVITDLIVEAMIKAVEIAVIGGDGTGKMLGITADSRVPAAQIVTLSSTDFGAWDAWKKKVFAKMPLAYKAGATFLMASGTFEGYIDGMTDANGQPVGRVNYGITDGPQERFGGKEVIQVEDDIIAPYDDAAAGAVVAIYCNLGNYAFNSNLQMMMFRYFDHDTNEWIDKAILIADGKLIDPNGVVIIKKGA
jgi:HK97 family phage major capsid protein